MLISLAIAGALSATPPPRIWTGDPIHELKLAFQGSRDPAQRHSRRLAALQACAGLDTPELGLALLKAYDRVDEELLKREEEHREYVLDLKRNVAKSQRDGIREPRVLLDSILTHVSTLRAPSTLEPLVIEALTDDQLPITLRMEVVELSGHLGHTLPKKLSKPLKRLPSREADALVQLTCIAHLHPQAELGTRPALAALSHPDPLLRQVGASALAHLGAREGIEPMVALLETETGLNRERLATSLQVLTGMKIGVSHASWSQWLAQEGQPYVAGNRPLGKGEPATLRGSNGGSTYHGLPLDGSSVMFVLDLSKSMNKTMGKPARAAKEGEVSRLTTALKELIRTLRQLPGHMRFNIVAFAGRLEPFAPEPVLATPDQIESAEAWLLDRQMNLGTRIHDALEFAFASAGRGVEDGYFSATIDTMVLLTDGMPIVGAKNDPPASILRALKRWNLGSQIRIHTVGLGDGVPLQFLKKVAKAYGGQFAHEVSKK